jgi:hypothetical protein
VIQIIEIFKQAEQGFCKPFLCKGDDDCFYYVKGFIDGQPQRSDQIREWLCAHLAKGLDLPIAEFCIVDIPEELFEVVPEEAKKLGFGPAFASKVVAGAVWMESHTMSSIANKQLAMDILFFDYWVHNLDRTIGNPNLLVEASTQQVRVIDHNMAFDDEYNDDDFFAYHLFREYKDELFNDIEVRASYIARLDRALAEFNTVKDSLPAEWQWLDIDQSIEVDIDYATVWAILNRYQQDQFWSMK